MEKFSETLVSTDSYVNFKAYKSGTNQRYIFHKHAPVFFKQFLCVSIEILENSTSIFENF